MKSTILVARAMCTKQAWGLLISAGITSTSCETKEVWRHGRLLYRLFPRMPRAGSKPLSQGTATFKQFDVAAGRTLQTIRQAEVPDSLNLPRPRSFGGYD